MYGEALLLELNLDRHLAVCYKGNKKGFFNTAYASSCKKFTEYRFADSVTYVAISANKEYDKQHPAGAELNEYFKMPDVSEFNQGNEITSTRMYALKGPEQNGEYVYTVKVLLADGTIIEAATEPVNIIK